ncbi:DNA cytosine methyltransferase [uncultured Desulfovibrio sp.]|uniref:DNA cytosine methyltransferase n=1 Tax=uncultured Desulfovibrio sp. TaxID=167968 RepID=UPI003426181B
MLKVGSLISGAERCDLGLSWADFEHRWFCEVDPFCRSVLARHWPGIPIYEDVTALKGSERPPVDALCGGFPCVGACIIAREGLSVPPMSLTPENPEFQR